MDKKALLIKTLNSKGVDHCHLDDIKPADVKALSGDRFQVETVQPGKNGNPDGKIIAVYGVWTKDEANADDENGKQDIYKGGIPTSDKKYNIYRII